MYYTTTNTPGAWIVDSRDRGRKKIYLNNKVYLSNNQEFLIELFNPLQESVLAVIKINGKNASSNGLVLRPGERHYLDCFVDDKRKFIFKTYEIENSSEALNATANNGYVEVTFFKEKQNNNWVTNTWYVADYTTNIPSCSISNLNTTNCYYSNSVGTFTNTSSLNVQTRSKSLNTTETGRVEKGDKSNQKFESVNMDFESHSINKISYQILPDSKKPVETKELKKNFCSECGNKLKGTERFCPSCGTRI